MANSDKILGFIDKKAFYGSFAAHIIYQIARFACLVYFHSSHDIEVEYSRNYNPRESYVIAANHRSLFDPPLIGSLLNSPTAFIAKKELFVNQLFGTLISLCSAIYLDRDKPGSSSIKTAKKVLNRNWHLLVFIEGTRSKTEFLGKAQTGAAFLARLCKKPLLPVGITYKEADSKSSRKKIVLKVGKPYYFSKVDSLEDVSNECLKHISELCDYKIAAN